MKRLFLTYVLVIVVTNIATTSLGVVTWLGVSVTAGTWIAGLCLVARDALHERGGHWPVLVAIVVGALVSAVLSPTLAVASGVAFLLSEVADWLIYTPLRRTGRARAALVSNVAGAFVDSAAFLALAGFPIGLVWSQTLVKVGASTAAVIACSTWLIRARQR